MLRERSVITEGAQGRSGSGENSMSKILVNWTLKMASSVAVFGAQFTRYVALGWNILFILD